MKGVLKARGLVDGLGWGEVLISQSPISFLEGMDSESGKIIDESHELFGLSVSKRVLIFPYSVGSSVGAYIIYKLKKKDNAPSAIINLKSDLTTVSGCALANIPLVDQVKGLELVQEKDELIVNGGKGFVILYS